MHNPTMASQLNPLAAPKGTKRECEICGAPAFIGCRRCRVTFWCSAECEEVDRQGIHDRICEFLGPLRRPMSPGSDREREQRRQQQRGRREHLAKLTLLEARKFYNRGNYSLAIPAAMQAVRFAQGCYGIHSARLVPSYLLLGVASLGSNDLNQAERYLTQANWIVLKAEDVDAGIKSELHRSLGRLYDKKGNAQQALRHLAEDIYYCSEAAAPDHPSAAGGYFLMAGVFYNGGHPELAIPVYDKVCKVWSAYCMQVAMAAPGARGFALDEAQEVEAEGQLRAIHALCEQEDGPEHPRTARAALALAALYASTERFQQAQDLCGQALAAADKLDDAKFAKEARDFAGYLGQEMAGPSDST